jgi:putative DNA primase/helicase
MGELWDRSGLRTYEAVFRVRAEGPLAYGVDGRFWSYACGVWRPAGREVNRRVCSVLGNRYRSSLGKAVVEVLAAELPEIAVEPTIPINFVNGMLRWDARPDAMLVGHHPEFWSTIQLPVSWVPDATCPEFDAFVAQSVPADDQLRLWQVTGYLMMAGNPLQRAFLLHGGGGNGKGVYLAVLRALLGRDNVSSMPLHDLAGDKFATAQLHNRLANICGDIDTTYIEHTGRIKELTGEDTVNAQHKYGQPFDFEPWTKMIFSANGIPGAADSSTGWTRRWEVVGFPYPPSKPDRKLKARLTEPDQLEGIAVKAIAALRMLMQAGDFDHGESAMAAHGRFARKSNKVLAWMHEEGHMDPSSWYPKSTLWAKFRSWDAEEGGISRMGRNGFYERLAQVPGMVERRRTGRDGWLGFRLNTDTAFGGIVDLSEEEETAPEVPRGVFDPWQERLL